MRCAWDKSEDDGDAVLRQDFKKPIQQCHIGLWHGRWAFSRTRCYPTSKVERSITHITKMSLLIVSDAFQT